jgi:hypothetical protein
MSLRYKNLIVSQQALTQFVAGEAVLLDLKSEKYFGLNPVGARFWQLIQESGDAASVRQQLLREYDVSESQLDADLNELVERLIGAGLLVSG